jgi:hypothetical protein
MPDYRIIVTMKDVAMGDAESVAQDTWDEQATTLDEGDFIVEIQRTEGPGRWFDTDWEPRQ